MAGLDTFWIDLEADTSLDAERIRVEQIRAVARHTPIIATAHLLNSLLVVIVFWNAAPDQVLIGWAVLVWGFTSVRLCRWLIHRHQAEPDHAGRRTTGCATVWAVVMGLLWGAAADVLFPLASAALQVFLAFVTGGMAAGAATSLATVPPAAVGFIAASMAPVISCFVLAGDRMHLSMAAMLLLFAILMVLTARNGYLRLLDSVRMAMANVVLLRDVEAAGATLLDAIESIGEAFVLFDRDDRVVLWNSKYLDVFAPIRDRIVRGMSFREICELCWEHGLVHEGGGNREAWIDARVRLHLEAGPPSECRSLHGTWLWVIERRTHDGGIAVTAADITPLKITQLALEKAQGELERRVERRTLELRAAKEEAERADAAKTRFLAAASHDLRQPLQAAILFQDLLALRNQDPALSGLIVRLGQSLEAQRAMLEMLLDISRLDAGIVTPNCQDFPVAEILARLAGEFAQAAAKRGIALRTVRSSALVGSDPRLIERMLRNLLSNALKYTASGRVLLGCRRRGAHLALQVWDTGIGIPQDQLTAIFEEFSQLHNEGRDRREGLGLGLAIVDRLGRLLGHRITVRSTLGRGSMFEIEVPCRPAVPPPAAATAAAAPTAPAAGRLILMIDDDPQILDALQLVLEEAGYRVIVAVSAEEAIGRLRGTGQIPDVVLADYRLQGGMTGSDAIRRVRQALASTVPGILLTGDTSPDRLKEARQSGFLLLHKPIWPDDLFRALARWR